MDLENVSFAIVLKTGKGWLNKKGEYPIKLRVTFQGKQKFYTLKGESATKDEFEAIINPNSKKKERVDRRRKFESIKKRAIAVADDLPQFTFEDFEREYLNKKSKSSTIQEYFEAKASELDQMGKVGTATVYRSTLTSLTRFDKYISFQKITPKYLKKYETWFVTEGKMVQKGDTKKGGSYTSVGIYMRNLRHIVNLAVEDRIINSYPFGEGKDNYQIPVSNNIKKALSIKDIALLFNYKSDSQQETSSLKYWLFSYLCNGMNFADMLNLRYSNIKNDSLTFIRQKTKDTSKKKTQIEVVLLPETFQIIEQLGNPDKAPDNYVFPILTNGLTPKEKKRIVAQHIKTNNKYMKRIAQKLGIDEAISTYFARHSYSTIIRDSGASTEFIAEQLGHQSTKVTQSYLDSFSTETKKEFQKSIIPK
jgi:integrase